MAIRIAPEKAKALWPLFGDTQETMVWSCLQGRMGEVLADGEEQPACALALLGDFGFFGGDACAPGAAGLLDYAAGLPAGRILTGAEAWLAGMEEAFGNRARAVTRYAICKGTAFDRERLEKLAGALPAGFVLRRIDRALYARCLESGWAADFVSCFGCWEAYERWGLGFAALKDGTLAAGASSYSSYEGGIEIEVDTKEEFRRQGLATACGARLILECLDRGLYPSWDAANPASVGLAEKLGYVPGEAYRCFVLE